MLSIQAASKPRRRRRPPIGLAVAGGGPVGGIYELGAVRAMEEALDGLDLSALEVYVGVSSGAFIAAGLANRIDTAEMCRIFITNDSRDHSFNPDVFLRPAFFEYAKRAATLPRLLMDWAGSFVRNPLGSGVTEAVGKLGSLIPTGLFDNAAVEHFLQSIFTAPGRSNDFRELKRKLYLIAVELDTGNAVRFGDSGFDDVPISKAVQASAALPGLYPPVEIKGKYFVDGALRRTLNASVALDHGAELVLAINPLVPFDASLPQTGGRAPPESLVEGGLPAVLSQTFRTVLQSRMQVGLAKYSRYVHSDIVLFEPEPNDADLFFTNAFAFSSRQHVCDHAYRITMADLRRSRERLEPLLERHGIRYRNEIVEDEKRGLLDGLKARPPRRTAATATLRRALEDLDDLVKRGD